MIGGDRASLLRGLGVRSGRRKRTPDSTVAPLALSIFNFLMQTLEPKTVSSFVLPDGTSLSVGRGRPMIVAFSPDEWNPARAASSELYATLAAQFGAEIVDAGGDEWHAFDSAGDVAAQFGVSGERAVFVLDESGQVAWQWRSRNGEEAAPGEILAALEALQTQEKSGLSRRSFLAATLAASAVLALAANSSHAAPARPGPATTPPIDAVPNLSAANAYAKTDTIPVKLRVNGKAQTLQLEPRVALLDALREYMGLTGSKKGCDHGQCGACTVHIDGERQLSCLTLAVRAQGREITTIEGLSQNGELHPMQLAFIENDAFQCGYCTPGQIMSATALIKEGRAHTDAEIRESMSGNLCRCAAYPNILAAVKAVRAA